VPFFKAEKKKTVAKKDVSELSFTLFCMILLKIYMRMVMSRFGVLASTASVALSATIVVAVEDIKKMKEEGMYEK